VSYTSKTEKMKKVIYYSTTHRHMAWILHCFAPVILN